MRAITYATFGKPSEVLEVSDIALPEPKGNEVRIKTLLATIHNHDLVTISGNYGFKPTLPAQAGTEAVGIIDAVGQDIKHLQVGQRVVASTPGTWAEYFIAPAAIVVPIPDAIDDATAAQLLAMPMSALLLLEFANVQSGQWIIQNGANGAVGRLVEQISHIQGFNVINLVRSASSADALKQLGAKHVITTDAPDWKKSVKAAVGDHPIQVGIDSVGGTASQDVLSLLAENSQLITFGSMSGQPMQLHSSLIIFKNIVVKGFWGGKIFAALGTPEQKRVITTIIQWVAKGQLSLQTEEIFKFEQIKDAVNANYRANRTGKILLKP
ncbi:zinc-binding dehydrogenase [Aquirhabdus sp.]|uniref:zinc-binding dehydrogenase n=1 Tax=Aquirhabdus sp. TaxID=2824160 RepID=UPI00396CB2DA